MANSCSIIIEDKEYSCETGRLLSEIMQELGRGLALPCGGGGKCGKCKVLATGALEPPTPQELKLLSAEELKAGLRLACAARIAGDCRVSAASAGAAQIAVEGRGELDISRPAYQRCGLAIDIGTTTIAMKLLDTHGLLGARTALNPQESYGADVINRISKSLSGLAGEIQDITVAGLNEMIESLCRKSNHTPDDIDRVVVTGNTAMLYLLTAEWPDSLAHLPFEASRLFGETVTAGSLGLCPPAATPVYLMRCMAAFIGSDISAAILSSGLIGQPHTALLVDVGTNGEMALWHEGRLICCSTAAGPAFEGAEIAQGMHGQKGAIDRLWVEDGGIGYTVIGGGQPQGICGSGIIDAISVMLRLGYIEENGALDREALARDGRLLTVDEKPACRIIDNIYVTQKDVRMVQLAKSAICSGIRTMLEKAELAVEDISALYLAGGFGNYLDINSAAHIGLIPRELAEKTQVIGNAALQGAAMVLTDSSLSEQELLAGISVDILDLGADADFMDNYIDNMSF